MHTTSPARRYVFILGSARSGGNTEALARRAAENIPADAEQVWLDLNDLPLPDFTDRRHEPEQEYRWPSGNEKTLLEATLSATDLVIASPLYWYSVSATVKRYLDYWSAWLRVPGADFRQTLNGRNLWAVTTVSDEDYSLAAPLTETLRISGEYMGMHWRGTLLGYGNRPAQVLSDEPALLQAKTFFTDPDLEPRP